MIKVNGIISELQAETMELSVNYEGEERILLVNIEEETKELTYALLIIEKETIEDDDYIEGNDWTIIHNYLEERGYIVCSEVERNSPFFLESLKQMEERRLNFANS
jgi:hypothetical protein